MTPEALAVPSGQRSAERVMHEVLTKLGHDPATVTFEVTRHPPAMRVRFKGEMGFVWYSGYELRRLGL